MDHFIKRKPPTKPHDNQIQMQMHSCKDFLKEIQKSSDVQFYDILLYRAMQPFPLRDDMKRVRGEGQHVNNGLDVRKDIIKFLKHSQIRSYIEQTGKCTPKASAGPHLIPSYQIKKQPTKRNTSSNLFEKLQKRNWKEELRDKRKAIKLKESDSILPSQLPEGALKLPKSLFKPSQSSNSLGDKLKQQTN